MEAQRELTHKPGVVDIIFITNLEIIEVGKAVHPLAAENFHIL